MSRVANVELGIRVRSCGEGSFRGVRDKLEEWESQLYRAAKDLFEMFDLNNQENPEVRNIYNRIEYVSLAVRAMMMELDDEHE